MYELSKEEKAYLKKIVLGARADYLEKNKYVKLEEDIENKKLISIDNLEINLEIKIDGEFCASQIEKIFRNNDLINIVEALTLKEKLVLFSYYIENKTDEEIGQVLKITGSGVSKIRYRTIQKINNKYKEIKGE